MIESNEQKYYRKRDNDFYTKYTKKEIWDRVNPYDDQTVIPFLQDMDYPYIEKEWRRYVARHIPADGRIIGRYISLMRLKSYQGYTWSDSAFLNSQNNNRRLNMIKVFTVNANGKISLTKEELQDLLNEAYWDGFSNGNKTTTYTYSTPSQPYYTWTTANSDSTSYTLTSAQVNNNDK